MASPSRALLFSLFPLVTVHCAALRGGGGRRCGGGGIGRGGAVRAIGHGPHSGLRVYGFGEVDAMDEANQLFYLLQGAVHLLLPGQDGVLHFHAFLQQTRRAVALSRRVLWQARRPRQEEGPRWLVCSPDLLRPMPEWALLPERRDRGGKRLV